MVRSICPNGTAAADLTLGEFGWSGSYGSGAAIGGDVNVLKLVAEGTINDSAADLFGLNVSLAGATLTSVANAYGILVTGKTGVDAGINVAGASTSGISISGAATQQLLLTSTVAEKALTVTSTLQTVTPVTITSTSAVTSAAYITAATVTQSVTTASDINMIEVFQATLNSEVETGNWANAIVGKINYGATGFAHGQAGVICAELDMPSTDPAGGSGQYTLIECELGIPNAYTSTVPLSFITANVWGTGGAGGVDTFEHNGFFLNMHGLTIDNAHILHTNTHVPTHGLRCIIDGTTIDLLFSTAVTP